MLRCNAVACHDALAHTSARTRDLGCTTRPHQGDQGSSLSGDGEPPRAAIAFTGVLRQRESVSPSDARHGARQGGDIPLASSGFREVGEVRLLHNPMQNELYGHVATLSCDGEAPPRVDAHGMLAQDDLQVAIGAPSMRESGGKDAG